MQIRTIAAILLWVTVALLIINTRFMSVWIWLTSIALLLIAVIVYFLPQSKEQQKPDTKNGEFQSKSDTQQ